MLLDSLKLVVLHTKHMYISYNARVPKVIEAVINNKMTYARGVEDGVISVFDTRTMEVGGGECSCMKRGAIDGFVLALCSLMDYPIVD